MSIERIPPNDKLSQSKDLIKENIEKLKTLFPEIVTEGKIDFESLKEVLGEELEEEEEFYRFTWAGKSKARREAHKPSTGTLRPAKEESLDWATTQNLYIEGDNLEVLKLLQKSYARKIKMIYIDPPYNTGKDFVYKDNYKDNLKNYQELTGQVDSEGNKLSTNSESDGRFHSNWLNMMYPRLRLARNLLKDDGAIFISIDNNEIENLKKISDEVFGKGNSIEILCWEKKYSPQNDARYFSLNHEYIVCYAKNIVEFKRILLPMTEEQISRYKNQDCDDRGVWKTSDLSAARKTDKDIYPINTPSGKIVFPPKGRSWSFSKERIEELRNDNRLWFGKNGDSIPQLKRFLEETNKGRVPISILHYSEVGHTESATKYLKKIFSGNKYFDYPKPVELLKYFLNVSSNRNDTILDFFSGSATTAEAVLKLNESDNGNRKFILAQLPEKTDKKSEAFKAGYKTIAEIGKERIRRVVKKIKEDHPEKSKDMDLGFKVFKLGSSNIKSWDGSPENLEKSLLDAVENIKHNRTEEDVLYEILLKHGLDLTLPIEERLIEGEKVFNVGKGALFVCLGDQITRKVAEGIGEWKKACDPEICHVIFKDNGLTDVEKTNSVQTLKRFGVNEIRSI